MFKIKIGEEEVATKGPIKISSDSLGTSIVGRDDIYDLFGDVTEELRTSGLQIITSDGIIKVEPRRTETQLEQRLKEMTQDYIKLQGKLMKLNPEGWWKDE